MYGLGLAAQYAGSALTAEQSMSWIQDSFGYIASEYFRSNKTGPAAEAWVGCYGGVTRGETTILSLHVALNSNSLM